MIRIVMCEDLDQDLLLLEHDALSGPRRWRAQAHLRRCPRCQERREHFARVSRLMAGAIREPDLKPWAGPVAARREATATAAARRMPARPPAPAPALARAAAAASLMPSEPTWQRMARSPAFVALIALLVTAAAVASILYREGILPVAAYAAPKNASGPDGQNCLFPPPPGAPLERDGASDCGAACHSTETGKKAAATHGGAHSPARVPAAPGMMPGR